MSDVQSRVDPKMQKAFEESDKYFDDAALAKATASASGTEIESATASPHVESNRESNRESNQESNQQSPAESTAGSTSASKPESKPASKSAPSSKKPKFDPSKVKVPDPRTFPERKKPGYKPKPFPDKDTNFKVEAAKIRSRYTRVMAEEIVTLARTHCPTLMWPKKTIDDELIHASKMEFDYLEQKKQLIQHNAETREKSEARKMKRELEKAMTFEAYKTALTESFTKPFFAGMRDLEGSDKTGVELAEEKAAVFEKARVSLLNEFNKWAPRINSWSNNAIEIGRAHV